MDVIAMSRHDSFRYQILCRFLDGKLLRREVAELLQLSERSVSRWARKVRDHGLRGVKHGNYARKAPNRLPDEIKLRTQELVKREYFDLNMTHLREVLMDKHKISLSYSTLRKWCHEKNLVKSPRVRRRVVRKARTRMPSEGLVLQMDGSHHRFNGRDTWCLIAAIDDATSEIPYAEFFKAETTLNCMKVLKKIIELKGVPQAIYTDQAGWAGGIKREHFNQFQRACEELGIAVIFAQSPEAKGRIERAWGTIQDRLSPELRLNQATSMKKANQYLQNHFLPNYWNKRLTVKPVSQESAYRPLDPHVNLDDIFCLEIYRKITRDNCINWQSGKFEIVSKHGYSLSGYEAVVRTYQNRSTKVFVMGAEVKVKYVPKSSQISSSSQTRAEVSLMPHYAYLSRHTEDLRREIAIRKIYGSYETYQNRSKKLLSG